MEINKRQNPISNVPKDALDKLFKYLAEKFSEDWLFTKGDHPLQLLWNRKDWLATSELFILAASIYNLERIDPKWVTEQIKNTKQDNENTRKGAFFEFISLEALINGRLNVKPAVRNQAGYDGIISLKNNSEIILSIKNYNLSHHHEAFLQRCKSFEKTFLEYLKKRNIRNILAIIDIPKTYPTENDWKKLENNIDSILSKYSGSILPALIDDTWTLLFKEMVDDENIFDIKYNYSYTLIITSSYHKNEYNNIYSKLQSSCHNLIKANVLENDKRINCILIHVPITVSVTDCVQWTNDYFQDYPDDPISCIVYYQPAVVTDIQKNTSHIHHCISFAARDNYFAFSNKFGAINFQFPLGTHGAEPTQLQFTNEKGETLGLSERYTFQSGNHFFKMNNNDQGSFSGTIKNQGSGISNHLICEMNGKAIEFEGIIPKTYDLLIV